MNCPIYISTMCTLQALYDYFIHHLHYQLRFEWEFTLQLSTFIYWVIVYLLTWLLHDFVLDDRQFRLYLNLFSRF